MKQRFEQCRVVINFWVVLQLLPLPFLPDPTSERQAAFKRFRIAGRGMALNTLTSPIFQN